jgi:dolichol-phosphate mannosyltransferase
MGVGGAVITGYEKASEESMTIIVKIDGDAQMNPVYIPNFIRPILNGAADYTKGNRFFELRFLSGMPFLRIFGNSVLSFVNKVTSGYWNIMDPTNGYTAIHSKLLHHLPLDKIDNGYFFESDMLFRLGTIRAVVHDIPLVGVYGEEESNLNVINVSIKFPLKYLKRIFKRIFYSYFLRDFNIGSVELFFGLLLFMGGGFYGACNWYESYVNNIPTPLGVIMLATLPIILGFQLLLSALNYDIQNIPRKPINEYL